jgi:(p)ppGpp synthase/HD superfamily hydrolase
MNAYLQRHFGKGLDKELSLLKNLDGHVLGTREKEDVLVQIGNLSRKPSSIIRGLDTAQAAMIQVARHAQESAATINSNATTPQQVSESGQDLPKIVIGGEKNLPYVTAKCCQVREGRKIVAHVGRHGIKIHDSKCPSLKRSNTDRIIPAHFENEPSEGISLEISITLKNNMGVLRQLGDTCYAMKLNITDLHTTNLGAGRMECRVTVYAETEDYYLFDRLSERLQLAMPSIESMELVRMG